MDRKNICVVTGTRADYGILYMVMKEMEKDDTFQMSVIATGMHLSPEFGLTYRKIEEDGFRIQYKVEMLISGDTPSAITKSVGLGVIGFSDAYSVLKPDLVLLLGDRYEIFAAAQAALFARIPISHIAGGDSTEGAFDEAIRHSITKMSQLHFVTNEAAARRVRQLGENPDFIFNVGSPAIDLIRSIKLLGKEELEAKLGIILKPRNLLVTYHPATLDADSPENEFMQLLKALDWFGEEVGLIFTMPNSDTRNSVIKQMILDFVKDRPHTRAYDSLGQLLYYSAISHVDAVVGNSSSGLYEVPSFKKPTVNIGNRQKGRLYDNSVINCHTTTEEIVSSIKKAFELDCTSITNLYGDGNSSKRIIDILKQIPDFKQLIQKQFYGVDER